MLNSRKLYRALATAGLLVIGSVASYAQTCSTTSTTFALRPAGLAELAGDIVLSCTAPVANASLIVTLNADVANTNTGASPAVTATANGQAGVINSAILNSISFANVSSVAVAGPPATNTITITGIRVNANRVPSNSSVTAFIVITSGNTVVPTNPNPTNIGFVLPRSFTFQVVGGTNAAVSATAAAAAPQSLPICVSNGAIGGFFRFTELFSSVFRTTAQEGTGAQNATQLRIIMGALPAGVSVWVPSNASTGVNDPFVTGTQTGGTPAAQTSTGVSLRLASGAATGAEPTSNFSKTGTVANPALAGPPAVPGDTEFSAITFRQVNATEVVYDVIAADSVNVNTVNIPFIVRFSASPTNGIGSVTAQGELGPTGASAFPRFVNVNSPVTAFSTSTCATSLLFPYVTNAAGFDTGMAIANTTSDGPVFTTASQTGTCVLNYYGAFADGGALPASATTTAISGGNVAAFTLTGGGSGVAPVRAGYSGYVIAQCNFQLAHGYAFVSDLGARTIAHGYLALVLNSNSGSRTTANNIESLNN